MLRVAVTFLLGTILCDAAPVNLNAKKPGHSHVVPTYFRRQFADGKLIDSQGPDYAKGISTPIIDEISFADLESSASIKIHPFVVENGAKVTVSWNGVLNPTRNDWIAIACPRNEKSERRLDHFFVSASPTWQDGRGSQEVHVFNLRQKCEFRYFRNGAANSRLVARSNVLGFENGDKAPLQGRIALTGDPTEMRVMWTAAKVEKHVVRYGPSKKSLDMSAEGKSWTYKASDMCGPAANSTGFKDPGYMFDVLLTKLKPATTYFYSYGSEGAMSPIQNFTTAPVIGDQTPYKFIVYGDMGVSTFPRADETAKLMLQEYRENDVKFIFHNGDISYARGQEYIWDQWHAIIEPYSTILPYMVGIGNHEQDHTSGGSKDPSHAPGNGFHPLWGNYGDDSGGECGVPMYNRFHMPDNGNKLWWYSYDYGMVHMIMMSTEHDYTVGSRQHKWLENDLAKVDRKKTPWILIGGHRAMYSSENIPSDYAVSLGMQRGFEDLLYKYRVDMAFWAHYHSYERTCKVYKEECRDDGITHIVVGTAGMSLDGDYWLDKNWSKYHENAYGYGRVTVANSSSLLYEWIRNKDQVVRDKVWIHK
eukprot:gene5168-5820_t